MNALEFEQFYALWFQKERSLYLTLREALEQQKPEHEITPLVEACYKHYIQYVDEKIRLCREDASYVGAGMSSSTLEAGFLWIGGWRPTTAVVLAYSIMGMQMEGELEKLLEGIKVPCMAALSAKQLEMLDSLQRSVHSLEDDLSNRLALLQMLVADQTMAKVTAGMPPPSESTDLSVVREAMEPKIAALSDLLVEAEELRARTIKEMLDILEPIQAGQYAVAAYEILTAVRKLGYRRQESYIARVPSNILEIASRGDTLALQIALQRGINPSGEDYGGRTPLHLAASKGHADCVSLLLKEGANVNKKDNFGMTPLLEALKSGHDDIAKMLVDSGAEAGLEDAGTELCKAAASGDLLYMERLIKHGIDPNTSDYAQQTPLHVAAAEGNSQAVKLLVSEGADVLARDRHGFTPLDEARASDNETTIGLLETETYKQQEAERTGS